METSRCWLTKALLLGGVLLPLSAATTAAQSASATVLLQARVHESVGIAWTTSPVPQPWLDPQVRAAVVAVESLWQLERGRSVSAESWVDQERGAAAQLLALHPAKEANAQMIWSFAPRTTSRLVHLERLLPEQRSSHQVHGFLVVGGERAERPNPDPSVVRLRVTVF